MKKTVFFYMMFFIGTSLALAQEFNKGTNVINVGLGLGGTYDIYAAPSQSPVISASFERGIWELPGPGVVSLGGYLGFKTYRYDNSDRWNYTIVGVRGAYHYNGFNIENLDVYGGAMVSYNILSYDRDVYDGFGSFGSAPGATGFIGGRWYFSEVFSAFAEAGYGVAYLTLGAALRI